MSATSDSWPRVSSNRPEASDGRAGRLDPDPSEWPGSGDIVVAFSGGPDSACLLHLLAGSNTSRVLKAVHVDHGLDHGSARRAEQACAMAEALGVGITIERVRVRRSGSLEANARHARYQALSRHIQPGAVLVTAHHADDVAETMLLRLLRGSGPGGLGGIPAQRPLGAGCLIRPLLGWRREQIQAYLDDHGLTAIQDPANDMVSLDRNFLRHEILPVLREHFPGCIQAFARSAKLNRAAGEMIAEVAEADLDRAEQPGPRLVLEALDGLTPFRVAETLRRWCLKHARTPPPGLRLDEFVRQISQAAGDRQPVLDWDDGRLQRYGGSIWLRSRISPASAWTLSWDGSGVLTLPHPSGRLRFSTPPDGLALSIRSGGPGERLSLHRHGGRRAVKKILAETGVPPWLRPTWPRLWHGNRLVGLGDRWLDADFADLLRSRNTRLYWDSDLPRLCTTQARDRLESGDE